MKTPPRKSILAAVLIALLCVPVYSASCLASEESVYQRVDELLLKGENQQAWELLNETSVAAGADNEKILWRKARTRYEMGRMAESEDMALMYFQEAEGNARAAIAEAPDQSAGYKWLAIALGAQSKHIDTKTQVQQSSEIKTNIEKAIALAPDDDIALLVLSRWHYKISGLGFFARTFANIVYGELPEASLKDAENLLLQAIALHDRIAHRYNLAKVYDRMGRRDDAKRQYQQALLLSVTFPEEAEEQAKAGKRLQRWD
jgi:tetratricopeptide (TPR) repeat protein